MSVIPQESAERRSPLNVPENEILDEAKWEAWLERGRARQLRDRIRFIKFVKVALAVGMIAVAVLWFRMAPAVELRLS